VCLHVCNKVANELPILFLTSVPFRDLFLTSDLVYHGVNLLAIMYVMQLGFIAG